MRYITRSDFDGLVCGMVLKEAGVIDSVQFTHPKDLQDGLIKCSENDILCNVPYVPGCGLWFDHHTSEADRVSWTPGVKGISKKALSCARIVYEYYGGEEKYPQFREVIEAADKVDSGQLTLEDIRNPQGWVLIGFLTDPRTGLGRFHEFHISNYDLMMDFIDHLRNLSLEEILKNPDVKERIDLYQQQNELFVEMVNAHTKIENNVIVTDLRGVHPIFTSNRFTIYSIFPEQNVSLWITDGKANVNVMFSCGYSILNRTCTIDIGALMLKYGGGGHKQVGTCQVSTADAGKVLKELVAVLKQ